MLEKPDSKPETIPEYRNANATVGTQKMTIAIEMQQGIKRLAGPRRDGDNFESMIARAARAAGISYRQAKTFFYAESDDPRSKAVEAVRAAVAKHKAASDELTELRNRVARLERLLASKDEDGSRKARAVAR
jgi:hypothetical protein